jgi:hypothetical protein
MVLQPKTKLSVVRKRLGNGIELLHFAEELLREIRRSVRGRDNSPERPLVNLSAGPNGSSAAQADSDLATIHI